MCRNWESGSYHTNCNYVFPSVLCGRELILLPSGSTGCSQLASSMEISPLEPLTSRSITFCRYVFLSHISFLICLSYHLFCFEMRLWLTKSCKIIGKRGPRWWLSSLLRSNCNLCHWVARTGRDLLHINMPICLICSHICGRWHQKYDLIVHLIKDLDKV